MWTRRIGCGLVASMVLLVPACSDDTDSPTPTTVVASSSSPSSSGTPATNAIIDIVECENSGGTVSGSGTLTNGAETAMVYALEIGVHDLDTDELYGSDSVDVGPVAPGEEAEWTIEVGGAGSAEVVCRTANVTGEPG